MKILLQFIFTLIFSLMINIKLSSAAYVHWQNDKVGINIYTKYSAVNHQDQTQQILVDFKLFNGWHISWDNPGDAGTPTEFSWNTSPDISVVKTDSSVPEKFIFGGIVSQYGYGKQAFYLFDVNTSNGFNSTENLGLKITWVACKDICEPEEADFVLSLPETTKNAEINSSWNEAYAKAKKTFPIPVSDPAFAENRDYVVKMLFPKLHFDINTTPVYFIPEQRGIFSAASSQSQYSGQNNQLELVVDAEDEYFIPKSGILVYGKQAFKYHILPLSVYENNVNTSLGYILLLAFVGGLLLNLMPCVFPILSLKALSLMHNATKQHHLQNAIMYVSGVLSCFSLVAGLLYFLRSQGANIGWGFQLQSSWFVAAMLCLFLFISCMMLGIVRISPKLLNKINHLSELNSFFTGFFAVLIASPCTGPFMGLAIGYTLFQPIETYFPIFLSLGLGYALPFALIELSPQAIKKCLPKPGKWMDVIHKVLALPIILTSIWLMWVLYHQTHNEASAISVDNMWKPYNQAQVQNLINNHQPVFIDFTAKWCLTCLLNEKTTLNTEKFYTFAQKNNISLFKVDWTTRDENVTTLLKQYGRNGVPLYVFYSGNNNDFIILPQLLTFDTLKDRLSLPNDS